MKNFLYNCPVKVIFGDDAINQLHTVCKGYKVLLVYGGDSFKRNGYYDMVHQELALEKIEVIDFGGHTATEYQSILDGIELCKDKNINCVIGIGGASVMDMAKVIAFGVKHENISDYVEGKLPVINEEKLLTILIPTYPSAGSEANGLADIANYKDGKHIAIDGIYADYAIIYPPFTYSLDKENTAYSCMVAFIQASVSYHDNYNTIARGFAEHTLKTILSSYEILLREPKNYRARANILWASFITTMGIIRIGRNGTYGWSVYKTGRLAKTFHGLSYREGLVVMYPRWLRAIAKHQPHDMLNFMKSVFGADVAMSNEEIIDYSVGKVFDLLKKGGLPIDYTRHGERPDDAYIDAIIEDEYEGSLTKEEMRAMLLDCYNHKQRVRYTCM